MRGGGGIAVVSSLLFILVLIPYNVPYILLTFNLEKAERERGKLVAAGAMEILLLDFFLNWCQLKLINYFLYLFVFRSLWRRASESKAMSQG